MRRLASNLRISRTTVTRKLIFLGKTCREDLRVHNNSKAKAETVEFDDVETYEHTKCKPLSITMVVEHKTRRILSFAVSEMPCNGKLAAISRKKYGKRPDQRARGRKLVFTEVTPLMKEGALIKSDQSPHYPKDVRVFFPKSEHQTFKGRRGASTGYGELKKGKFDPLFSFNHTAACLRDSIKRLARRTWCTTKKKERLADHLALYALFHNTMLLEN